MKLHKRSNDRYTFLVYLQFPVSNLDVSYLQMCHYGYQRHHFVKSELIKKTNLAKSNLASNSLVSSPRVLPETPWSYIKLAFFLI